MSFNIKPPYLLRALTSELTWRMPVKDKRVFLTFDDGPVPGVTEFVLDTLEKNNVRATFFCLGRNVEKHPGIYTRILGSGHATGNHTHSHVNGWKVSRSVYLRDIIRAEHTIESELFRPPYGRITPSITRSINKRYRIIMWDVLSYDFDRNISPEKCFGNVALNTRPGSIIVFHDSVKANKNLSYALPRTIEFLKNEGFSFGLLG